jgi:hypothetical protein
MVNLVPLFLRVLAFAAAAWFVGLRDPLSLHLGGGDQRRLRSAVPAERNVL